MTARTQAELLAAATAAIEPKPLTNEGHGHVVPRLDGGKMRCGGPRVCKMCAAELARQPDLKHTIADLMALIAEKDAALEELDFLRHEGGPQSVAAMEACMRDVVLPRLRASAEDLFRCVSVRNDPGSISPADWRDIAPDMEAVLAVEHIVGRPDDEYGRILDPVLDAASWRAHL